MKAFFMFLLHILYFVMVAVIEILLANWLAPLIGVGWTVVVCILVFIVLMMIYAALFWKWSPPNIFDSFSDFDFPDFS